jgi:hypothetical protein
MTSALRAGAGAAALTALGVLTAVGCATVDARSDYDRSVDFSKYRTFEVLPGRLVRGDEMATAAPASTLAAVKDRIAATIISDLQLKGLTRRWDDPDLFVGFVGGARTRQELVGMEPYDPTLAPGWGEWWGPTDLYRYDYQQGTLIIDVIDAHTKKLVWRSIVEAERDRLADLGDPRLIKEAVGKALKEFPPKAGGAD